MSAGATVITTYMIWQLTSLLLFFIIIIIIIIINEFHRDASLTKTSWPLCVTCFTSHHHHHYHHHIFVYSLFVYRIVVQYFRSSPIIYLFSRIISASFILTLSPFFPTTRNCPSNPEIWGSAISCPLAGNNDIFSQQTRSQGSKYTKMRLWPRLGQNTFLEHTVSGGCEYHRISVKD